MTFIGVVEDQHVVTAIGNFVKVLYLLMSIERIAGEVNH